MKQFWLFLFLPSLSFAAGTVAINQGSGGGTITINSATSSGGGSATPSGAVSAIQYSSGSTLGGDTNFQYDSNASSVTLRGRLSIYPGGISNSLIRFSESFGADNPVLGFLTQSTSDSVFLNMSDTIGQRISLVGLGATGLGFAMNVSTTQATLSVERIRISDQSDKAKILFNSSNNGFNLTESSMTFSNNAVMGWSSANNIKFASTTVTISTLVFGDGTQMTTASSGSGGYALEPATAPAVGFTYGLYSSTIVVNSGSALGIINGANRARFRMAGILSLQNTNSDAPDSTGIFMAAASTTTGSPTFLTARRSSGTVISPAATANGQIVLQISGGGYGTTGWAPASTARMDMTAEGDFTDSSQPTGISFMTAPAGSTATVKRMVIASNGAITDISSHTFTQTISITSMTATLSSPGVGHIQAGTSNYYTGLVLSTEMASTSVTPGSYTNVNLTVDQQGRITSASNGTTSSGNAVVYSTGTNGIYSSPPTISTVTAVILDSTTFNVAAVGVSTAVVSLRAVPASIITGSFPNPVTFSSTTIGLFEREFFAAHSKLPGSNSPYISNSTGETSAGIYFDDTSTQTVTWSDLCTRYDGRPLFAQIIFTSTATSGTINFGVSIATQAPNLTTTNFDILTYNVEVTTSVTTSANSNALQMATVLLSTQGLANGQYFTVQLRRLAQLLDTAVGYARVRMVWLYE